MANRTSRLVRARELKLGKPRRPSIRRPEMDRLEARTLLATSRATFASLPGDAVAIGQVDPADLTSPRGRVLLTFQSETGSAPVVVAGDGRTLARRSGQRSSRTLVEIGVGPFAVAAGGAPVAVSLAGDMNGDFRVDADDLRRIARLRGARAGRRAFVAEADLNPNGVIGLGDLILARRNLGASTTVRPLSATLGLAPGTPRDAQGRVTAAAVTLVGLSHPGAAVGLDLGADGSVDLATVADASGSFRFLISPGLGATTLAAVTDDRFGQRATARLTFDRV